MSTLLRTDGPTTQPTLLLADDSVTIQHVIALTFVDEGIRVVAVGDGEQAIKVLDQNPPDIVLADVGIQGPSGYDLARYIRDTPRLAHIPVLLSAGAFEPVDQVKAAEVGCAGVLAKPFEPQIVIARVRELLSKGKGPPASKDVLLSTPSSSAPWNTFAELPLGTQSKEETSGDIDDYFDRLDKAFALLSDVSSAAEPAAPSAKGSVLWHDKPQSAASAEGERGSPRPVPGLSPSERGPQSEPASIFRPEAEPKATPTPVPEPDAVPPPPEWTFVPARIVGSTPTVRPSLPSLADAFAALLAAEQSEGGRTAVSVWPSSPASAPVVAADELVEQVTLRVLERVSDRVVRETVEGTVSATAERLVRDEIERIKAHIT